jgi:Emfourin
MRLTLTIDGGFGATPGPASPLVLSTEDLGAEEAAGLLRLVEEASALPKPEAYGPSATSDERRYVLKVEGGSDDRTLSWTDAGSTQARTALVRFVRQMARPTLPSGGAR